MNKSELPIITVTGLTKIFGGRTAVDQVNLSVNRGEIFGFLGPNGSGKTTTLRMLCGLLKPNAGDGQCMGFDILSQSYDIKQRVGYMPQRFSLYEDLSIEENIRFMARLYSLPDVKSKIESCLDSLGLTERRHQLAGALSGGWKQRLALAVALMHEPELLLLDEPTAGVDPKARRDFWQQIHQLSEQGITTLVSTHYMDEAERCHRLAYIAKGHLVASGTADEIIAKTSLKTWVVMGHGLPRLAVQLEKAPGVTQVTAFGTALHVSGTDETLLKQSLAPFMEDKAFTWESIPCSLEDAFIALGAQHGENVDV